ncbi:hypothetical protein ACFFUO_02175 [Vibrio artabrorum]|uniref:Uncharacterized protein n=1 Tax=Vibrio artabrorum TaxID=446374 RepID=A0ABT8CNB2_9VIBR|nr:hypothetical protein [Vibrio artabrorum]MDN3701921.1 hypothetical protein [Vibrio artabrorum]
MKHFLPSSVMLTPFLVKYYDDEPEDTLDNEEPQIECSEDSEKNAPQADIEHVVSK